MAERCKVEEEIYTHEYLWRSSSTLLNQNDPDLSYHHLLPALLLSFMAFEAFINFLGIVLLPNLWKDEKTNFKGKGIEGKINEIVSMLPQFTWKKGQYPYQRIKQLEAFRGLVAHGNVNSHEYMAAREDDGTHFQFQHAWDSYLTKSSITKSREDIRNFCQSLLIEARNVSDHPHLTFDAFEGSLASGMSKSI